VPEVAEDNQSQSRDEPENVTIKENKITPQPEEPYNKSLFSFDFLNDEKSQKKTPEGQ